MTKRYISSTGKEGEFPKVDAFLEELFQLYAKYDLAISHQDEHGAFKIEANDQGLRDWIRGAHVWGPAKVIEEWAKPINPDEPTFRITSGAKPHGNEPK